MITWQNYDEESEKFFQAYESYKFEEIHKALFAYLPIPGAQCLDIGAGSGRDAAAMAELGYFVTAIEPSKLLRQLAEKKHRTKNILWIEDSLPNLINTLALKKKFEFILLSAVWMHVLPADRPHALETISKLLSIGAYVAFTLRGGPSEMKRSMYPVSAEELLNQAKKYGLESVHISTRIADSMNRKNVFWEQIVLRKLAEHAI